MDSRKSKLGLLLILVLILISSASARVYIPQDVNQNYPEIAFNDKGSSKAQWDALGQSESYEIRSLTHLGPFGDYDGDGSLRIPIRATSGTPYVKANKRNSTDYFGLDDENGNDKPKSGKILSAGLIDDDLKTDLLFIDQNGELAYIDSDSYGSFSQSAGGVIGTGDVDRDGYEEYAFIGTSTNLKYFNYEEGDSDPDTQSFGSASVNSKIAASTLLHLGDGDGYVEVAYQTGSSYLKAKDTKNSETGRLDDGLGNIKGYSIGTLWLEDGDGRPEMAVAGNSNEMYLCSYDDNNGDCQQTGKDNGFGIIEKKTKGTRSYIPPFVKEPKLNNTPVTQGESVKVVFNATDWEGYTDIVNKTAEVKFTSPGGASYIVDANEFTEGSAVPGSSKAGGFVPEDGKTKAFKAKFNMPDDADTTQDWNVSVQVKDEKMTGTLNWTTFTVEKALVERNETQGISMDREDTSRRTSLGKSQITGLIMDPQGFTEASMFRDLSESLGFSSGKSRNQSLGKNLMTGMAFSRSGNGFKTVFSTLRSDIFASSEVFDIYSAFRGFDPVFGFSDSPSDKAFFSESVDQSYGLDGVVSGQSLFIRTDPLSLTVDFGGNRSSDVGRSFTVGLEAGSSPLTGLAFGRSFDPVFSFSGIDTDRSGALFSRSSEQGLSFPQSLDKDLGSTYFKTLTTPFDLSSSPVRSGVDLSVSLSSALDLGTDGSRDSIYARSFDSIISSSTDRFIGQYLFRNFFTDYIADSGEMRAQNVSRATDNSITGSFTSSRSSSLDRLLSGSIAQTFGFSRSDAFFERSSSQSISISEVFEGERTFGRAMSFSYSFVSSPVESTAGYFRALSSDLFLDNAGDSSVMFERQESTGISSNDNFTRGISVSRYLSTALTQGLTVEAFDGVMIALDQTLGFGSASSDLFESSRGQDTSLETSSDYSSSISFFRTFSQSVGVDLGLGDLIDFVLEFFRDDPDDGNSGDGDSNGGNNGDGNDGGPTSIPGGNNEEAPVSDGNSSEEENSTNNSAGEKDGNDEDIVKIIEASLRESEVSNNEAAELTENITGVDRGQQLVIDISHGTGRENLSNGSETNPTLEKRDLIHVNTVEFEAERSQEDPDISLTTFDEVGEARSIIKDKNVYEATEVSTNFDTTDASLIYEVKKRFLSKNNATVDEIVVSRWENQSKVGELKTKLLNESEDAYTIRAISPRGFSVFVVSLKSSGQQIDGKPEEGTFISLPKVSPGTISLLLLISTVLLLRREILIKTFTSDLKVKKAKLKASMFFLKLRKRLDVRKEREAGKEEYSLAEEVESLENKVEVMQYKKEKQSEDLERMEEIYKRLRYECTLLAERIKEAT